MKKAGVLSILFVVVMFAVGVIANAQQPPNLIFIVDDEGERLHFAADKFAAGFRGMRPTRLRSASARQARPPLQS